MFQLSHTKPGINILGNHRIRPGRSTINTMGMSMISRSLSTSATRIWPSEQLMSRHNPYGGDPSKGQGDYTYSRKMYGMVTRSFCDGPKDGP